MWPWRDIIDLITREAVGVRSLTFVGSGAPDNQEPKRGGDLDVVLLTSQPCQADSLALTLSRAIPVARVVSGWGLVSASNGPVLHLLVDTPEHYVSFGNLFRRSLGKYRPTLGEPLSMYAPRTKASLSELSDDSDGPVVMYQRVVEGINNFGRWVCKGETRGFAWVSNHYSDHNDYAVHAFLHGLRNTLRAFGQLHEFAPTSHVVSAARYLGLPESELLESLVVRRAQLRTRRVIDYSPIAAEARRYLRELCRWIAAQ